jgi:hypothetical protein
MSMFRIQVTNRSMTYPCDSVSDSCQLFDKCNPLASLYSRLDVLDLPSLLVVSRRLNRREGEPAK